MPDYRLSVSDSSLDDVRIPSHSLKRIPRRQDHPTDAHAVKAGGPTASGSDGVEPGRVVWTGEWLGTTAAEQAARMRTILDDTSVTTITLQAIDGSDSAIADPYNGDYRIAGGDESQTPEIGKTAPDSDLHWEFKLPLIEL